MRHLHACTYTSDSFGVSSSSTGAKETICGVPVQLRCSPSRMNEFRYTTNTQGLLFSPVIKTIRAPVTKTLAGVKGVSEDKFTTCKE